MLRKIGVTTVLSAAILFGGVFTSSAASVSDQSSNLSYKKHVYYSVNGEWKKVAGKDLNDFVAKCFPGYQIKWNFNKQSNKPVEQVKQPEEKKTESDKAQKQPAEKPAEQTQQGQQEQTDKEQVNDNKEKVEQPAEQPQAQAPVKEKPQQQTEQPKQQEAAYQLSQYEQEVVELTNNERAKHGLSPLKIDTELSRVAREKSNDMAKNGYFSHNSPVYGSPFDMMKNYGITYRTAGENIAKGQRTPQEVVNAWMNSEGHRANILNGKFTHIGVGYVERGNHWTQQFIGK